MARLDRLGATRDIAQTAAVIGRHFSYQLIEAIAGVAVSFLQASLDRLVEAELVYQRGTPPEATYTFKHALVQDTAYGSLLRRIPGKESHHHHVRHHPRHQCPRQGQVHLPPCAEQPAAAPASAHQSRLPAH